MTEGVSRPQATESAIHNCCAKSKTPPVSFADTLLGEEGSNNLHPTYLYVVCNAHLNVKPKFKTHSNLITIHITLNKIHDNFERQGKYKMIFKRKLPIPQEIKAQFPLTQKMIDDRQKSVDELKEVFEGKSDKFVLVIGPCSADSKEPVMDYISRLR